VREETAGGEERATKPRASTHHILPREKQGGDVSGTDWSEDLQDRSGREWRRAWPPVTRTSLKEEL